MGSKVATTTITATNETTATTGGEKVARAISIVKFCSFQVSNKLFYNL